MISESVVRDGKVFHPGFRAGTVRPIIGKPDGSTAILDYGASIDNAIGVAPGAIRGRNEIPAGS